MRHSVVFVNAPVTSKVILILDGHFRHKNIEALEYAKANGIIMLCCLHIALAECSLLTYHILVHFRHIMIARWQPGWKTILVES